MPDENVADLCPGCGTPNTRKNQFCSECGKSLVRTTISPRASPPQTSADTGNPDKKRRNNLLIAGAAIFMLLLVIAIYASGTLSSLSPQSIAGDSRKNTETIKDIPNQQSAATTYQVPATVRTSAMTSTIAKTTAVLSEGVTITYPSDWEKEEVSETSLRDYGRVTTNIANFYSPDITSDRAYLAQPNVDTSSYTSLSIDVDPNPVSEFDQYFNLVTIALQKYYGHIDITKHNYQLKISQTDTFQGYESYQMDFDTTNMRGSYIFTNVDGTIYIFAFKNPSPYSTEVQDIYKSIKIVNPESPEQKHR